MVSLELIYRSRPLSCNYKRDLSLLYYLYFTLPLLYAHSDTVNSKIQLLTNNLRHISNMAQSSISKFREFGKKIIGIGRNYTYVYINIIRLKLSITTLKSK